MSIWNHGRPRSNPPQPRRMPDGRHSDEVLGEGVSKLMRSRPTPGPWSIIAPPGHPPVVGITADSGMGYQYARRIIADIRTTDEDARLIAAAPTMYEALEEIVAEFEEEDRQARQEPGCLGLTPSGGVELAYIAIRKARGE